MSETQVIVDRAAISALERVACGQPMFDDIPANRRDLRRNVETVRLLKSLGFVQTARTGELVPYRGDHPCIRSNIRAPFVTGAGLRFLASQGIYIRQH